MLELTGGLLARESADRLSVPIDPLDIKPRLQPIDHFQPKLLESCCGPSQTVQVRIECVRLKFFFQFLPLASFAPKLRVHSKKACVAMDIDPRLVSRMHHVISPLSKFAKFHHKLVKPDLGRSVRVNSNVHESCEQNVGRVETFAVLEIVCKYPGCLTVAAGEQLK
ncbi:hypothetical protein ASE52_12445 [Acidovorax sp. Root275]|nr:hypothetical protein ASE52_12445 [Acidovorax sp. Root275]